MSDYNQQRNIAVIIAVAAVAILIGYLFGRGGPSGAPEIAAVGAPGDPASGAATEAIEPTAPLEVADAAPARPSDGPVVGQRTRAPRATAPAPTAQDPVESGDDLYGAADVADGGTYPTTAPPARTMERVEIPAETKIVLELVGGLSSETAQVGDEVVAEMAEPIRVDGEVVLPVGTRVTGRVTEAQALKKIGGQSILGFTFDHVDSGDGGADILASFRREGKKETGKDAATIAGGAAAGAIVGNQAKKNDRGKLIGAILGAAAGAAVASRTQGEVIELPDGAQLELTLREPVHVLMER